MRKINMENYLLNPNIYELRNGTEQTDAPKCPYGNTYQWIGYDVEAKEYVRVTKSVFKLLIKKVEYE